MTPGRDADADAIEHGHRWQRRLLAGAVLPAVGAAAVVGLVEGAGGDLGAWATWQAVAALVAAAIVPAAVSVWLVWRDGVMQAVAWAVVCIGLQVAMVFGVGFLALGLGPA